MIQISSVQIVLLLISAKRWSPYCESATWPQTNASSIQLLHLFPTVIDAPDANKPFVHTQAMFKAAILLSTQYNISVQGQFFTGVIADTTGTLTNATAAACRIISSSNIAGIVGPAYSRETPSIAGLGQRINIPVISYSATDPALSDRKAYPAFYRTIPSDNAAALAIVKLFQMYNWTSCIIIYQNDAFGSGAATAITNAFFNNGLEITNTAIFDIATSHMKDDLKNVLATSPTTIVVLWMSADFATIVLQDALQSDVLGPNYLWILSESIELNNFNNTVYSKLIGMLTVEPTVASVANAPFNQILLNEAYELWKQYEPETYPGPDYVDYFALFAFDAAWILVQSLQKLCSLTKNTSSSCISPRNTSFCFDRQFFDTYELFAIINNMTFLGVSGHIQFDPSSTNRKNGIYYVVKNAQSISNRLGFVRVLSYADYSGWQRDTNTQVIWPGNSLVAPTGHAKLEGITLRIGVIQSVQFTNIDETVDASGNKTMKLAGYMPDIINLLQAQLKFIPDIRLAPSTKSYNEIINDVVAGVYDIVVADVTVTATRRKIVDFSSPIYDNSMCLLMRKDPISQIELFDFLKPLSWNLWLLIIGAIIFTSILICFIERDINEHFQHKSLMSLLFIGIWFCCCNFIGRDVDVQVRSGAGRLLSTAMFFLTLVLVASYTANLASELTISKSKSIISGVGDLKSGKIPFSRIGVPVGTAEAEYYMREISGGVPNYYPLYSIQQIYDSLLNNVIDVAFFDKGIAEYVTNNVYCNLTIIGEGFDTGSFGIVMRKEWLYAQDLDVGILVLRESGDLERLNAKWFQVKQCPDDAISSDAIEVQSLIGLFMLFGVICVVSFFLSLWSKLGMAKRLSKVMGIKKRPSNNTSYSAREETMRSTHNSNIGGLKSVVVHGDSLKINNRTETHNVF